MAADPDPPPTAGNPPPFSSGDVRISPSGPYLVGAPGGLIRFGADAIIQDVTLPAGGLFGAVPRSTSPAAPVRVTFPAWTPNSTLVVWWHLCGGISPGVDPTPTAMVLTAVPVVDVGAGPEFIDNAHLIWGAPNASVSQAQGVALAGCAAIKLANPAQPPVVELFYNLFDGGGNSALDIAGVGLSERAGSGWLCCAELSAAAVFQLPPEVVLTPFIT